MSKVGWMGALLMSFSLLRLQFRILKTQDSSDGESGDPQMKATDHTYLTSG